MEMGQGVPPEARLRLRQILQLLKNDRERTPNTIAVTLEMATPPAERS
jgi:hypothetical protein